MPPPVIAVYKPAGATPRATLDALRVAEPSLATATLGYAGRLDPMARGVLLVLVDDENKAQARYLALEKEYRVELLLGVATDSYDALGIVTAVGDACALDSGVIASALEPFRGTFIQAFPPFSSAPVAGRPLFAWAREGLVDQVSRPARPRTVHALELLGCTRLAGDALHARVRNEVAAVRGDFRQAAVLARWEQVLSNAPRCFLTASLRIVCSSGTYVRSIAHDVGARLGIGGIALGIERTRVGDFTAQSALRLDRAYVTPDAEPSRANAT